MQKKRKPSRLMRLLRKLFPAACSMGKRRLRRYARCRTLDQAWALADSKDRQAVLGALGGSKFKRYICSCGLAGCQISNAQAQPPAKVPAALRARYEAV